MNIHEYQAKEILKSYGVTIQEGVVADTPDKAIEAAKEALKDDAFFDFALQKNKDAKKVIYDTLDHLELDYVKSSTNFVFFKSGRPIDELGRQMLEKGVRIGRPFPPFYNWCRISTGTPEEMVLFSKSLIELY